MNGFPPTTRLKTGRSSSGPPVVDIAVAEPPRAARATYACRRRHRRRPPLTTNGPVPPLSGPRIPPSAPPARTYIAPVQQQQPQTPLGPPDAQVLLAGRSRFILAGARPGADRVRPQAGAASSDGLDIGATDGTPVRAAATGDVVYAGALPELGNLVLVKHEDAGSRPMHSPTRRSMKIRTRHPGPGGRSRPALRRGGTVEVYFEIRYAPTPRDKAKPVDPALALGQ